jgi:DNA-binding LacI/PurR family transcriptional regulator
LGRQAAALLERRIGGHDAPPERVVLEPTLRVRESALGGGGR